MIGAAAGASCIGPAYELVMMIDTVLKRAKKRHLFSLTFLTPEPFLGHFGVGGIGASPRMVQDEFAQRSIDSVINAQISEARPDRVVLADSSEYVSDFSLVIPAFRGSGFVRAASGLANPKGFVREPATGEHEVSEHLRGWSRGRDTTAEAHVDPRGRAQDRAYDRTHG